MYARRFRAHSVFFGFGAIAAAAVIAGCTTPHGASPSTGGAHSGLVIRGSLGYAARIALPPEAEAIIEVRAASAEGALLAERRFALEGRQVPIPFELTVDRARLTATRVPVLRGTIRVAGRPDWLSPAVAVDRAAASIDVGTLMLTPARTDSVTRYLSCGEQSASLGGRDGATWLNVGARRFDLRAVAAASGAKYEAPGAAGTTLWDRGERALLVVDGVAYPECRVATTAPRPFRATGNEPFWQVQIGADRVTLRTMLEPPIEAALPQPTVADGARIYAVGGGHPLVITIADRTCVDTMSGMPHPHAVTVRQDGRMLAGCGGDPARLLQAGEWTVDELDGKGIVEGSRLTLVFGHDGRLSGTASCNTYAAAFTLSGESLTIGRAAATRKACAPALMRQEDRFLRLLGTVQRFDVGSDGALILLAADRRVILARHR
jgi:heat shock protein HslJ/uncharacterized lipoprotein YbaY